MADWPYNTQAWQRLRRLKLSTAPLCEGCADMEIVAPANTVDHRVPVREGGNPFPPIDGLASYCTSCHSAKTARGVEAGSIRTSKPRKGCNLDGTPLDRRHPWHSTKIGNKSLRPERLRPTPPTNIELVSIQPGQRSRLDIFDDNLDDLWV